MGAVNGEEEQGTHPQPLPLGSYSPSVLPISLPVELGSQLGLWDELGKGREDEISPHQLQLQSQPLATTAGGTMATVRERSWNQPWAPQATSVKPEQPPSTM